MTERRRIYTFPGGVLETDDYGDTGGVYLEWKTGEEFEHAPGTLACPECPAQLEGA